jgi:hypothetical protein
MGDEEQVTALIETLVAQAFGVSAERNIRNAYER